MLSVNRATVSNSLLTVIEERGENEYWNAEMLNQTEPDNWI